MEQVRIGIVGTSWWVDSMYLPPLRHYPAANIVAICGRNRATAQERAVAWGIPYVYSDYRQMFAGTELDAVIIATPNDTHHVISMEALRHGLHVLCEKPLALQYEQAREMANCAAERGLITVVPFTYRYMPTTRRIKQLLDEGFIGQPYHIHLRYFAGYGRDGSQYSWRFDKRIAGSGALGDLGSHFLDLADWFYGDIDAVCSNLATMVERPALDPLGEPYEQLDDTAMLMLRFKNGAHGLVHVSTLAHESSPFGQLHAMDLHGSNGTLHHVIDWNERQTLTGGRDGEDTTAELPVPDAIWGAARRHDVIATYKDVFRKEGHMVREFVDAVLARRPMRPDFSDGARVQALLDAALLSSERGGWINVSEITQEA